MPRTLPPPTWHGTDGRLREQYGQFVLAQTRERLNGAPQRVRDNLAETDREIRFAIRSLETAQTTVQDAETKISELEDLLILPDTDTLNEAILQVWELPEVVGMRVSSKGRLVILLRLVHEHDDKQYDAGDFELSFAAHRGYWSSESGTLVRYTRLPNGVGYEGGGIALVTSYGGVQEYSVFSLSPDELKNLVAANHFDEVARRVIQTLQDAVSRHQRRYFPVIGGEDDAYTPPEPAYGFTVSEPFKFLQKNIAHLCLDDIESEIKGLRSSVSTWLSNIEGYRRQIRSDRAKARSLRAELATLEKAAEANIELDEAKIDDELRFITTSIPGVMGMKFDEKGRPIVHIRTSNVYDGRRYDLGDYEVTLGNSIHLRQTRTPKGVIYWSGYEDGRGSFCFGSRSSELQKMLAEDLYGQFMHVLVNSMNAVNDGNKSMISRYLQEIPLDDTWKAPQPSTRPRRRSPIDVLLGRMALENDMEADVEVDTETVSA